MTTDNLNTESEVEIDTLQDEVTQLRARLATVERERDSAREDRNTLHEQVASMCWFLDPSCHAPDTWSLRDLVKQEREKRDAATKRAEEAESLAKREERNWRLAECRCDNLLADRDALTARVRELEAGLNAISNSAWLQLGSDGHLWCMLQARKTLNDLENDVLGREMLPELEGLLSQRDALRAQQALTQEYLNIVVAALGKQETQLRTAREALREARGTPINRIYDVLDAALSETAPAAEESLRVPKDAGWNERVLGALADAAPTPAGGPGEAFRYAPVKMVTKEELAAMFPETPRHHSQCTCAFGEPGCTAAPPPPAEPEGPRELTVLAQTPDKTLGLEVTIHLPATLDETAREIAEQLKEYLYDAPRPPRFTLEDVRPLVELAEHIEREHMPCEDGCTHETELALAVAALEDFRRALTQGTP